MKICFVSSCDLSVDNGGRTHTIEFAKNWSRMGHEVYLFSKGLNEKEAFENFRYIKVPYIPIKGLHGISFSFFSLILLTFYNIRFKFNIIYERYTLFSLSTVVGKLFKIPVVIELNEIPCSMNINQLIQEENNSLIIASLKLIKPIFRLDAWLTSELSTRIITTTKLEIENIPKQKLYSLPFGASIEMFKPINQNHCRQILSLPNDIKIICFVGTFLPWQGIEYIIDAMPTILKERYSTVLIVVGDVEPKMQASIKLKQKIIEKYINFKLNKNVIFVGRVPYEKVQYYINASDVCVVAQRPMRSGFSPLKLFEYMACGKPVVASDIEGVREIILESNGGILVPPENPAKLAEAVIRLLNDEELIDKMGKNGLRSIEEKYNWEKVASEAMKGCGKKLEKIV